MAHDIRHLTEDALQGFLDGSLPEGEAGRVQEHVDACRRCRSELEAWEVLFQGLGEVGEIAPSPGFADRVMTALPRPEPVSLPLAARIRSLLPSRRKAPTLTTAAGHVTGGGIQDFLEGLLPRPEAQSVETHLHGCRLCRDEVETFRTVMTRLDTVPRVAPSPDFAERVMAHVRIQQAMAVAQPTLGERIAARLEAFSPRTRRGLAGLAGAAVTPVATLALMLWVVFSHPLVTVGNLATFLWLQTRDAAASLVGTALGEALESGLLARGLELVQALTGAPGAALLAFALFSALTMAAVWVLYRNLIATHTVDEPYAHAS